MPVPPKADTLRPFARRPPNCTVNPELKDVQLLDHYAAEGGAPHLFAYLADGAVHVLPMTETVLARLVKQGAEILARAAQKREAGQ